METRIQEIAARSNSDIKIRVIPGHFATNHSHVNYYVDMTGIKSRYRMAKLAAAELAAAYAPSTSIDTIICLVVFGVLYRPLDKYLQARDIIRR